MTWLKRVLLLIALTALPLVVVACGGSSESEKELLARKWQMIESLPSQRDAILQLTKDMVNAPEEECSTFAWDDEGLKKKYGTERKGCAYAMAREKLYELSHMGPDSFWAKAVNKEPYGPQESKFYRDPDHHKIPWTPLTTPVLEEVTRWHGAVSEFRMETMATHVTYPTPEGRPFRYTSPSKSTLEPIWNQHIAPLAEALEWGDPISEGVEQIRVFVKD